MKIGKLWGVDDPKRGALKPILEAMGVDGKPNVWGAKRERKGSTLIADVNLNLLQTIAASGFVSRMETGADGGNEPRPSTVCGDCSELTKESEWIFGQNLVEMAEGSHAYRGEQAKARRLIQVIADVVHGERVDEKTNALIKSAASGSLKARLRAVAGERKPRRTHRWVGGASVDIGRAIAGEPPMKRIKKRRTPRPVTIAMSFGYSYNVGSDEVVRTYAAVMAAVEAIESSGVPVRLVVTSQRGSGMHIFNDGERRTALVPHWVVKSPGKSVGPAMMGLVASPTVLRHFGFALTDALVSAGLVSDYRAGHGASYGTGYQALINSVTKHGGDMAEITKVARKGLASCLKRTHKASSASAVEELRKTVEEMALFVSPGLAAYDSDKNDAVEAVADIAERIVRSVLSAIDGTDGKD